MPLAPRNDESVPSSPCNATFELFTVDVLIYDYKINYKKITLPFLVFYNNKIDMFHI